MAKATSLFMQCANKPKTRVYLDFVDEAITDAQAIERAGIDSSLVLAVVRRGKTVIVVYR